MSAPSPYSVTYQSHQLPTPNDTPFEDQHVLPFVSEISLNSDTSHGSTGSSTLSLVPYEMIEPNDRSDLSQYLSGNAPFSFDDYLFATNDDFAFSAQSLEGINSDSNTSVDPLSGPVVSQFVSSDIQYMTGNTTFLQQPPPASLYVSIITSELDRVGSGLDIGFPTYQLRLQESEATPFSSFTSTSSTEPASSNISGREVELGSFAAAQDTQVLQGRLQCEHCYSTFSDTTAFNRHTKTHQKPYKCNQCHWAFKLKKDLRRHKQTHNVFCTTEMQIRGGRFYFCKHQTCQYAVKGFQRRDNLLRHIRNVHGEEYGQLGDGNMSPEARTSGRRRA
ncbi:hypothetical protein V2W45_1495348 [Cenococcum geophilum]